MGGNQRTAARSARSPAAGSSPLPATPGAVSPLAALAPTPAPAPAPARTPAPSERGVVSGAGGGSPTAARLAALRSPDTDAAAAATDAAAAVNAAAARWLSPDLSPRPDPNRSPIPAQYLAVFSSVSRLYLLCISAFELEMEQLSPLYLPYISA